MNVSLSGVLGGETADRFECSRAGCRATAQHAIRWRNPKIHSDERRKIWLACAEHVMILRDFLAARSFPLEVVSIDDLDS